MLPFHQHVIPVITGECFNNWTVIILCQGLSVLHLPSASRSSMVNNLTPNPHLLPPVSDSSIHVQVGFSVNSWWDGFWHAGYLLRIIRCGSKREEDKLSRGRNGTVIQTWQSLGWSAPSELCCHRLKWADHQISVVISLWVRTCPEDHPAEADSWGFLEALP